MSLRIENSISDRAARQRDKVCSRPEFRRTGCFYSEVKRRWDVSPGVGGRAENCQI